MPFPHSGDSSSKEEVNAAIPNKGITCQTGLFFAMLGASFYFSPTQQPVVARNER